MGWTFYNASGQRLSTAATSIDVLDIDGATDIGAAIVDADLFIIDDGAGGTNRKTAASRIKTYVGAAPSQANQAALEAETNEDTYAPPDLIKHSPGVAKMWIQLDGTGTVTDNGSYNVSGVVDNAVGDYTATIDTDMTDTGRYVMVAFAESPNVSDDAAGPNLGSMRVRTQDASDNLIDVNRLYLALFGDQ